MCSSASSVRFGPLGTGGSSTKGDTKSSLFPDGNDHPGDLETQSSSVSTAIGFQRLRSKGPPGVGLCQTFGDTCNKRHLLLIILI